MENDPVDLIDPSGLDWIEYTGQTLTVWPGKFKDRGHEALLICKATSGYADVHGNYQNTAFEKQELGPVPHGHYRINLKARPDRWASLAPSADNLAAAEGVQMIRPTYTLPNGQLAYPGGWGTWRARLDPIDVHTARHNFYLHNSTKGYTHGCIETCDKLYGLFVTYHDQGLSGIDVLVNYTTTSTYGGTDKP